MLSGPTQRGVVPCQLNLNLNSILFYHSIGVSFQLSETDYREPEGLNAMMPVIISKASEVFIANPVTFMVIPLTVDQALAQGMIESFEAEDPFSPNRAG